MHALEHEHRLAARERETLAETAAKLHAREQELRNREETFRRKLEERIDDRLRDARREIDSVLDALKAKTDALAAEAERRMAPRLIPTGETGAARAEARAAIEAIGERLRTPAEAVTGVAAHSEPGRLPAVGDRVLVGAFGLEGVVQALHDRDAEVDVRGKRLRARVDELRVVTPAAALAVTARARAGERRPAAARGVALGAEPDRQPRRRGRQPDRKVPRRSPGQRAEVGPPHTRVRHGPIAPRARRHFSSRIRLSLNFAPAPANQGGGGVTVVELKD